MDERVRFVGRLLEGEKMAVLSGSAISGMAASNSTWSLLLAGKQ